MSGRRTPRRAVRVQSGATFRVSAAWDTSRVRPVEVLEIAREILPRRLVQKLTIVTVLVALTTGTFDDVVVWLVMEKAAAVFEDLRPILERLIEQSQTQPQTP
jgi:hypothetical protein